MALLQRVLLIEVVQEWKQPRVPTTKQANVIPSKVVTPLIVND